MRLNWLQREGISTYSDMDSTRPRHRVFVESQITGVEGSLLVGRRSGRAREEESDEHGCTFGCMHGDDPPRSVSVVDPQTKKCEFDSGFGPRCCVEPEMKPK